MADFEAQRVYRLETAELECLRLAGGEGGRDDLREGEIFGGAAGALLPVEEELSVAVGEADGWTDLEVGEGAVDPVGGAFEFGPGSDGGFIED